MLINVIGTPAVPHDHWINHGHYLDPVTGVHCCNENDCKELTAAEIEGVLTSANGGLIVGGVAFHRGQLHKSEDGKWYRCANRCVFRPVEG
jgi:hypothetical protein